MTQEQLRDFRHHYLSAKRVMDKDRVVKYLQNRFGLSKEEITTIINELEESES